MDEKVVGNGDGPDTRTPAEREAVVGLLALFRGWRGEGWPDLMAYITLAQAWKAFRDEEGRPFAGLDDWLDAVCLGPGGGDADGSTYRQALRCLCFLKEHGMLDALDERRRPTS
jgi:hypothetical protein